MALTLYAAPGCMRCNLVKSCLQERQVDFEERDVLGEGREAFQRFYRDHRGSIVRGPDGIELPIAVERGRFFQGAGPILAWLLEGGALDGFVGPNRMGPGWVDGLRLSGGDPEAGEGFLGLLRRLRSGGLRLELETDGRNPSLLEAVLGEALADRLLFRLKGPPTKELERSLTLAGGAPEVRFVLTLAPVPSDAGGFSYPAPEQAAELAATVRRCAGSGPHRFFIQAAEPSPGDGLQPPAPSALFRYRTACRRFVPSAEILK
jgi:pyruvate formate lyase activating enzyme